jgi:small subunit ribosomal protein S3Ae
MAEIKKRKTVEAWKKKEWYTVTAPKMFEEKEVGKSPAENPENLINRVIEVPLYDVTGNVNHQFVKMRFRVFEVKGKTAYTQLDGYELVREFLRRNVRRGRSMIRTVLMLTSKDGVKLKVIAFAFTARKIDASKKDQIRVIMADTIKKTALESNFEELVQKLLFGGISSEIFKITKTIAPVKRIEMSKCEVLRSA